MSPILGEVVLFALEVGRTLAGDLGREWEWEERSEDLRRAFAFSRFEKKPRKAGGIGGREEGEGVVGEDEDVGLG